MVRRRARSELARARLFGWGYLVLLFVACHTPPPLARTPAVPLRAGELAPQRTDPAPAVARPEPQREPRPEPDYTAEQAALRERYHERPSLGVLRGEASYYGAAFAGRRTANGEIFEPRRYTAAHRTLPFGTVLRVKRLDTGAVVYVRINDRGPFGKKRRILDLSEAAAAELDMLRRGIAEIRAEVVERGKPKKKQQKRSRSSG
jgi:rare lipoprotein A